MIGCAVLFRDNSNFVNSVMNGMDQQWRQSAWSAGAWRSWLTDHGSLTRRLRLCCTAFAVRRLYQGWAIPHRDECAPLGLRPGRLAMVREVLLMNGTMPLVFAHSVIPRAALRGRWASLAGLGNKPLGEALFSDPRVRRQPLTCRRLDRRHPLYHEALAHLDQAPAELWARRSRFSLGRQSLLVTEVFLPEILQLP